MPLDGVDIAGGVMRFTDDMPKRISHTATSIFFKDLEATLKFGNDVAMDNGDYYGLLFRRTGTDDMLVLRVNAGGVQFGKCDAASEVEPLGPFSAFASPLLGSQPYWVHLRAMNEDLVGTVWDVDPLLVADATPLATVTYSLTSTEQDKFNVLSTFMYTGIYAWLQVNWADGWVDDFSYLPLSLTGAIATNPINMGNFAAQPIYELTGRMKGPVLTNTVNGTALVLKPDAVIPDGETWVADIAKHTLRDANGNNAFKYLDDSSDWPELEPGENPLELQMSEASSNTRLRVIHRTTVM